MVAIHCNYSSFNVRQKRLNFLWSCGLAWWGMVWVGIVRYNGGDRYHSTSCPFRISTIELGAPVIAQDPGPNLGRLG